MCRLRIILRLSVSATSSTLNELSNQIPLVKRIEPAASTGLEGVRYLTAKVSSYQKLPLGFSHEGFGSNVWRVSDFLF